jgi:hypothetical protein
MKKDKNSSGGGGTAFPLLVNLNIYHAALINSKYLPPNFRFVSEEDASNK